SEDRHGVAVDGEEFVEGVGDRAAPLLAGDLGTLAYDVVDGHDLPPGGPAGPVVECPDVGAGADDGDPGRRHRSSIPCAAARVRSAATDSRVAVSGPAAPAGLAAPAGAVA